MYNQVCVAFLRNFHYNFTILFDHLAIYVYTKLLPLIGVVHLFCPQRVTILQGTTQHPLPDLFPKILLFQNCILKRNCIRIRQIEF